MGDKTNAVDFFCRTFGLTKEIENKPLIDLLKILNFLINLEEEPASKFVVLILPSWIDSFPEVVNCNDATILSVNLIPK